MTLEVISSVEVEEAIIRAWKGEDVAQTVPMSPVGEADWDGSLILQNFDNAQVQIEITGTCQYTEWPPCPR